MECEEETEMITSDNVTLTERRREDVWLRWCSVMSSLVQLFNQVA